jgi:hypothetical protein
MLCHPLKHFNGMDTVIDRSYRANYVLDSAQLKIVMRFNLSASRKTCVCMYGCSMLQRGRVIKYNDRARSNLPRTPLASRVGRVVCNVKLEFEDPFPVSVACCFIGTMFFR